MSDVREETGTAPREKGLLHYVGLRLSGALLLLVFALAVIVIVVPRASGSIPLTVLTGSMAPGLPPGTLIVVQPVDVDDLAVGDVITYQIRSGDPAVITHRIIAINAPTTGERTFETKGDNNSDADPDPVGAIQVQGKVWYSVPLVGFANNAVNGENRAWIVPGLATLLIAYAGYMIASGAATAVRKKRAFQPRP
ncbi:signal peptidase I [Marisediminicola antarctica]|uniref:Signal peptidase I n=1 Tax=Marisediminicola antarctica TaxID=674079 RepID=A0A7L5AQJ0_9MICO|nr:signal peptidase I [Marisediminicola antarctica]QHO70639.1 signal peptidase I [Marisediminicola antarctica]